MLRNSFPSVSDRSRFARVCLLFLVVGPGDRLNADQPIATLAVISNPYITTLPAGQIRDERGVVRGFLAQTGPDSMEKTIRLVNRLKPDACVVQGSLTWSGSDADFSACTKYLDRIRVPVMTTPGHWDRASGTLDRYRRACGQTDVDGTVRDLNGVQLIFAGDATGAPTVAVQKIRKQLAGVRSPQAVLLFTDKRTGEFSRPKLTLQHEAFWNMVADQSIAVRFDPTRYGHRILYENRLPVWNVGSTAWSERGSVAMVRVFADRIEIAQIRDPEQPAFSISVPNPVNAERLPAAEDDPYGCPSYSQDLADNPEFTFALVADPQFDRVHNRDHLIQKAAAGIRELNQLRAEPVFVAGDLVNNNLPEEWTLFRKTFGMLKPRLEVVAGNHDVLFNYDFVEQSYSSAPRQKPEYATIVRNAVRAAEKEGFIGATALFEKYTGARPDRIVEYGSAAFILVSFLTTRADEPQLKFLKRALAQTLEKRHVFVVAHYPSLPGFGNSLQGNTGGDEVLSLLREHRVTGYLFGHRHRNGVRVQDGTVHLLSDNMGSIHLVHVFQDRIVIGRKEVGVPIYPVLTVPATRRVRE